MTENGLAAGSLDKLSQTQVSAHGPEHAIFAGGWAALPEAGDVPDEIVLAVNGKIVSVVSPCCDRADVVRYFGRLSLLRSGWSAYFSSRHLNDGPHAVTAYAVVDAANKLLVALPALSSNVIYKGAGLPPASALLGMPVAALRVREEPAVQGHVDSILLSEESPSRNLPLEVRGWAMFFDPSKEPLEVAVAVNEKIAAVTTVCCDRPDVSRHFDQPPFLRSGWRASVPGQALRVGANEVSAYVVLDAAGKRVTPLQPAPTVTVEPPRKSWLARLGLGREAAPAAPPAATPQRKPLDVSAAEAAALLGRRVETLHMQTYESFKGNFDGVSPSELDVATRDAGVTIKAGGWAKLAKLEEVKPLVAVAVNGEIAALVEATRERRDVARHFGDPDFLRTGWRAHFSSRILQPGPNQVAAYVVVDARTGKLAALPGQGIIYVAPR